MSYYVVFEYTENAGGYAGNRYCTEYPSKAVFEKDNPNPNDKTGRKFVLAHGISEHEAQRLALSTSLETKMKTVREVATGVDGEVDPQVRAMETMKILMMQRMIDRGEFDE